jgi:hypothetical protein
MNTDSSICDHDDRGGLKRKYFDKEKWLRKIRKAEEDGFGGLFPKKSSEPEQIIETNIFYFTHRSRKYANAIPYPNHYSRRRFRSDSPPPKSKRTNAGTNKGKSDACPHCRPTICIRMNKEADTKRYVREIEKDSNEYIYYDINRNTKDDMIIGSELSIYSDNNWHSLYEYIENIKTV